MRYPKFIKKGDLIVFSTVSFGANSYPYYERVQNAKRKFNKLGYFVQYDSNVLKSELPYLATDSKLIAIEFMNNYSNSNSKLLLSVGGGELQCETLPYLDFDYLKQLEPKWFCGFSDNTNYSFLLTTICDVASIYGCCAGSFGMYKWHQSILDNYLLLTGEKLSVSNYDYFELRSTKYQERHPLAGFNLRKKSEIVNLYGKDFSVSGRLLGGCLDILILLCGTKYDKVKEFNALYQKDGIIWFIEACDLSIMSYRRALFQLKEAGWFDTVKAFIIGRPLKCYRDCDFELDRISILSILDSFKVPVIADVDLGHIKPSMPLICGSYANLEVIDNNITIDMILK